ncbi:MAG: glycosyltransferase family 4 protein [Patescibacteria group bacterium]
MSTSITVLCNTRFPSTAAHGAYLARLCESFSGQGIEVELVVPKRFREVHDNPLKYYSVKSPFKIKKLWSFDFLIFGSVLGRLAFVAQYVLFYLYVMLYFLFRSRKRIIYTMDNLGCLLTFLGYRVVFETHVGIGSYRKYLLPLLMRAERVIAVNSIIKEEFVRAGFRDETILVAPNGVDLKVFSGAESREQLRGDLKLPTTAKIISYVGKYKTMGMDKGVDGLVTAFASLHKNNKNTHLLIVGLAEGEKLELVQVLSSIGAPSEAYTLIGHVSQSDVAQFMRASDVLVMNYPNTDYYANFMSPMKMFEYMAARQPIVTSDLPSIREILDDTTALFVRPDDEASLEEVILRLLNDENLCLRLASKAYERVTTFTWQKRAGRIIEFISNE